MEIKFDCKHDPCFILVPEYKNKHTPTILLQKTKRRQEFEENH